MHKASHRVARWRQHCAPAARGKSQHAIKVKTGLCYRPARMTRTRGRRRRFLAPRATSTGPSTLNTKVGLVRPRLRLKLGLGPPRFIGRRPRSSAPPFHVKQLGAISTGWIGEQKRGRRLLAFGPPVTVKTERTPRTVRLERPRVLDGTAPRQDRPRGLHHCLLPSEGRGKRTMSLNGARPAEAGGVGPSRPICRRQALRGAPRRVFAVPLLILAILVRPSPLISQTVGWSSPQAELAPG